MGSDTVGWGQAKCPLYGVAGCPLLRGLECIDVYGDMIWTYPLYRRCLQLRVSVKRGSTVVHRYALFF